METFQNKILNNRNKIYFKLKIIIMDFDKLMSFAADVQVDKVRNKVIKILN